MECVPIIKNARYQVTLPNCLRCRIQVGVAFGKLEEGYESAIKDYYKKQIAQLNNLVSAAANISNVILTYTSSKFS